MAFELAQAHLNKYGFADRIMTFDVSSATVALAAEAVGCEPARIAKTLSFEEGADACLLIVTAGDAKIDNRKFKDTFQHKATMLTPEAAERLTHHAVGGVCPFGVGENAKVYLDVSLQQFEEVYPACGSSNSAVRLSIDELMRASEAIQWVDVCKTA